jgi:predicted transcriptional regulator
MTKAKLTPQETKLLKRAGVLISDKISYLKKKGVWVTQSEIAEAVGKAQPTINMLVKARTAIGVNVRNWSYKELKALFTVLQFSKEDIRQFVTEVEIDFPEV